jgi:acyl-CoA-dependent ceramide synthase
VPFLLQSTALLILVKLAKCLKYLGFTTICDIIFGVFMVVWIAARHVTYMMICWSLYHDLPMEVTYGCYSGRNGAIKGPFEAPDGFWHLLEPFRDPEGVVCWNDNIKWGFLGALLVLQCITLLWFWMIVQVAVKVVKGGEADDVRSDDEGEEELEEHKAIEEELLPYEEEVGVESINLKGKVSNASKMRYMKSASSATGVSLPGHSDRKELLGRIGCDKGV